MKYSIKNDDNIVTIFDNENKIIFYPSKYLVKNYDSIEQYHFCYLVNTMCDKDFFINVFKYITDYKDISLDYLNKKYNFNFNDSCEYSDLLLTLNYNPDNQLRDIYFVSYRNFGFSKEQENEFNFIKA